MFKFLKRKKAHTPGPSEADAAVEAYNPMGKNFEFLITGDVVIPSEDYERIMTPNSFPCTKIIRDGWPYYQVDQDEFSYSWEIAGIQMTFNESADYMKAKKIAEEVVENIKATGQMAELNTIDVTKVYRFD
jgi:hypothetical protein